MASTNPSNLRILGVPISSVSSDELSGLLRSVLGCDLNAAFHIVTYNPEYAMAARKDRAFLQGLQDANLVTADGVGIIAAARLHRKAPRLARITGVDLLGLMARVSQQTGEGLFLLGAGPGVAPKAAATMHKLHPGANFCGWWWQGSASAEHDGMTLERIRISGASMLAVAYGAPGQIHWIIRNQQALAGIGVRLVIGVGGAFDYWAGEAKRPPKLIQKLGLEWLFRLINEPWRWRRQLVLPHFALLATLEALKSWLPQRLATND